jgi:hypothetical protein
MGVHVTLLFYFLAVRTNSCVNGLACLGDKNITRLTLATTQAVSRTSSTLKMVIFY